MKSIDNGRSICPDQIGHKNTRAFQYAYKQQILVLIVLCNPFPQLLYLFPERLLRYKNPPYVILL